MQLPLAADSFVCKLARAWLHIDHATPQWTAEVKLTWAVRTVADQLVKLTWAVGPPTDRPGQVRQESTEHPLGALLRARVGAFAARFAASRGGAVHEGGASCGDDCGADRGGNSSCVGGDGGGEGRGGGGSAGDGDGGGGDCGDGGDGVGGGDVGGGGDGGSGEAANAVKALQATTTLLTACVAASLPQLHGHGRSVKKVRTI